jgi:hypothetical protein
MTRALLTLTRHRLHRRPARTPLLNIRLVRSRCNDLVTTPSSAPGRNRQRLLDTALPPPGFLHEPKGPQPPPERLRPARRRAAFPGPKPRSSYPPARLTATSTFRHSALPEGKAAPPPAPSTAPRSPWRTPGHDPRAVTQDPPAAASTACPRASCFNDRSAASAHTPEGACTSTVEAHASSRRPSGPSSSDVNEQLLTKPSSGFAQKQVRLQGLNPLESPLPPSRLLQRPGARCSPGFSAPTGFFSRMP